MKFKNLKYRNRTWVDRDGVSHSVQEGIQCLDENDNFALIPISESNTDYLEVLAWVEEGNTIEPADE